MIEVVAGIIIENETEVLIFQRNRHKRFGLLWEFPGGKIEEGENHQECLVRELKEELCINPIVGEHYYTSKYEGIILHTYFVNSYTGIITLTEHETFKKIRIKEIMNYKFPKVDTEVVNKLIKEY